MQHLSRSAILLWMLLFIPALQAAPDFPALTGRVVDQAGILSAQTRNRLDTMLAQHEQATSNQVVVVTLASLQGYAIDDFGYQLGRHWGIGQKGRDNGVLLIVAPAEHKVRIEVGYGLEGTLTDALSRNIIDTVITPRFRKGDMAGGIVEGTRAILDAIQGTYKPLKSKPHGRITGDEFNFFGASVMIAMFFSGMVRNLTGNRLVASAAMGGIAGLIGSLLFSSGVGFFAGLAVALIVLFTGLGGGGGGGYYGGGRYGGGYNSGSGYGGGFSSGGFSSGGFSSGGFSGGGGGFGGGGASGGW